MALKVNQCVKIVPKAGWVQLATILAFMVFKCQWIVAAAFVNRDGSVSDVTVNVPSVEKLSVGHVSAMKVGEERHVSDQDVQV